MNYDSWMRPLLFRLPPERAHEVAMSCLSLGASLPGVRSWLASLCDAEWLDTEVEAFGLRFRNPVGLAAGFDKNGRHLHLIDLMGFGFMEVGSVTAKPTMGNPKPRLFRLASDGALINRMGLNNDGAQAIAARLRARDTAPRGPVFVNVARTPSVVLDESAGVDDYVESVVHVRSVADAVVLNVSCPNTGDGRTFEEPGALDRLLGAVRAVLTAEDRPPLLVKISSDVDDAAISEIVNVLGRHAIAGIVAVNTTVDRSGLKHADAAALEGIGPGGLSGAPLHERALGTVARLHELTSGTLPIIGVGGIVDAAGARAMFDAGATLIELYTGLVYEGPRVVRRIMTGLKARAAEVVAT